MKTVRVANGMVQGQIKTILDREIVEFLCIPYCKPPINELRFQKSQAFESFTNEVINKLKFETCPPQLSRRIFEGNNIDEETWIPKEEQSENCLYVNIWCPLAVIDDDKPHPVVVWIHGGGFVSGSSSLEIYNGSNLCSHENIIVVSFNYRIGMLGFLCLDDELINGNLGIGDQVHALKWIHENISMFNGDPDNVTICGNSAGGCSVSLHLLIEESWQYFNKAIILSGVCLSDWALLPKKELARRSQMAVNILVEKFQFPFKWKENISKEDKKSIIKFLQSLNFQDLVIETEIVSGVLQNAWAPCIGGDLIPDKPRDLFKSGKYKKCPTIFLNVENEGSYFIIDRFPQIEPDDKNLIDINYFEDSFLYFPYFPHICNDLIKEEIKSEYNITGNKLSIYTLERLISDQVIISGSFEMASIISRSNKEVYYIWFRTFVPTPHWPKWFGVKHTEEINYLFGHSPYEYKKFMENIGHFIKNGILKDDVPLFDEESKQYIIIDKDNWIKQTLSDTELKRIKFWESLRLK